MNVIREVWQGCGVQLHSESKLFFALQILFRKDGYKLAKLSYHYREETPIRIETEVFIEP